MKPYNPEGLPRQLRGTTNSLKAISIAMFNWLPKTCKPKDRCKDKKIKKFKNIQNARELGICQRNMLVAIKCELTFIRELIKKLIRKGKPEPIKVRCKKRNRCKRRKAKGKEEYESTIAS